MRTVLPAMHPEMVGLSMTQDEQAAGVKLTMAILTATKPLVDGQPTQLAIDAFAAALIALLTHGCQGDAQAIRLVLNRYAERILDFAEKID